MQTSFNVTTSLVKMTNLSRGDYVERTAVEDVLYTWVTPNVCVFGVLGNLISLIILLRVRARAMQRDRGRESTALLGMVLLAVSDTAFCMARFPSALVTHSVSKFTQLSFNLYYQVYGPGVVSTFLLTSTWVTVVLSLFRYIGICHPLRARHIVGACATRLAYFIVILSCVVLNLPSFWLQRIVPYGIEGREFYLIEDGVFGVKKQAGQAFMWIRNVIGLVLPAILLTFCNCSLIKALRESQRMHKRCHVLESRSQASFRITLTLIVIVFMFILLVFPCEIINLLNNLLKVEVTHTYSFLVVRAFANVFQVINFSSNFIVYCAIGDQFREVFCDTFFKCSCHGGQIFQQIASRLRRSRSNVSYTHALRSHTRLTFLPFVRRSSSIRPSISSV